MRLYEVCTPQDELEEGLKGKLATAALSAALAFSSSHANADQVYVYQDNAGNMQPVSTQAEVPANANASFVVNTDDKTVKSTNSATTSAEVKHYKETLKPDSVWGKDKARIEKYGLSGLLANNPFSPGVKQDVMMQALQNIHNNRPPEIGDKVGKLEFIDGNDNITYKIAVINYTNGQLKVKMGRGGQLRSVFVPFIDRTYTGKDIKYIIYELDWTIGKPGQSIEEPNLDIK